MENRDFDKMGRRKFLSASTMSLLGYSFMVSIPAKAEDAAGGEKAGITPLGKKIESSLAGRAFDASGEPNMEKIALDCDVLVAGGGLAGVCAAIASARAGAKTVLVQDRSRLGGNSSSEVRMHPLGIWSHKVGWREAGILEEIKLEHSVKNPQMSWEMWDLVLYDKCVSEKNLTLLLDTSVYLAETSDGRIKSVMARSDHSLKIYKISAKQFVDCTGDARIAMEAGATLMSGREGSKKYGEELADIYELGKHLCASVIYTSKDCGKPTPFTPPSWAKKIAAEDLKFRDPRASGFGMGYAFISHGGMADTLRDTEVLRFELLSIILGVWDYIKNSGKFPETANLALDSVGMIPAKRDTYRVLGEHIFTVHDIKGKWREMPDQIAAAGWALEDQTSKGFYAERHKKPAIFAGKIDYYNIPFGSLVAKDFPNLLMAGRDISCSHMAFSSTRIMNTCATTGQVSGTAAALCAAEGISPKDILKSPEKFSAFQQRMLRDGVIIAGVKNSDPLDLARSAKISASSCAASAKPENVVSGMFYDALGSCENRWIAPIIDKPALKLEWDSPREISKIILNLDTGCRMLTITRQPNFFKRLALGAQPECLRDYRIVATLADGSKKTLAEVKGNYQKRAEHDFEKVAAKSVELECLATNGSDTASVFEVRVYA